MKKNFRDFPLLESKKIYKFVYPHVSKNHLTQLKKFCPQDGLGKDLWLTNLKKIF